MVERLLIDKETFLELGGDDALWATFKKEGFVDTQVRIQDHLVRQFYRIFKNTTRKYKRYKKLFKNKVSSKLLETVAYEAYSFCHEWGLSLEEGFRIYCDLGFQLNLDELYKFKGQDERISAYYEVQTAIQTDPNSTLTQTLMDLYQYELAARFGKTHSFSIWDKFKFVKLSEFLKKKHIPAKDYMVYLFDSKAWMGVPFPLTQLIDENYNLEEVTYKPQVKKIIIKRGFDRYDTD